MKHVEVILDKSKRSGYGMMEDTARKSWVYSEMDYFRFRGSPNKVSRDPVPRRQGGALMGSRVSRLLSAGFTFFVSRIRQRLKFDSRFARIGEETICLSYYTTC